MELFNIFPVASNSTLPTDIVKLFVISLPDNLNNPELIVFPLFVMSTPDINKLFIPCIFPSRSKFPEDVNVIMYAPKGPGSMVRETYLQGFGIPGLVAVEQDATGDALQIALGMAKACGFTKAGVIETTFKEETETDLFGEQAVLCGGLTALINAGFQTLVEAGYQPEIAYFETCHEVKLIVDDIYEHGFGGMWKDVSNTAEYGGLTRRDYVITEETKKGMKKVLSEIQDGTFKKQFADENATDAANLKEMRAAEDQETIEVVGERLRKACGLQKDD